MPPVVPRSDRIVRRTAMIGAATAAFLLLTADYGPNYPNPVRKAMESSALFSKPDRSVQQADTNSKPDDAKRILGNGTWQLIQCNLRVVSVIYTKYLQSTPYSLLPSRTGPSSSLFPSPHAAAAAAASHLAVPRMWGSTDGETPEVTLETSMGAITVEMYYKHAPKTCRNFVELARRGCYDNTIFHRIIKDFIVQGGDPTGTGRGGESIYGAKFEDEIKPELKHTGAGILSMANAGPNTNGSQFFITLAPCQSLDGKHTIFGRVCRGMEIVKRLGSVQTNKNDRPIHEVKILRAIVKD